VSHRHVSAPSRRRSRRFLGIELVDDDPTSPDYDRGGPGGPDGPDGPDDGYWDDEPGKKSLPRRLLKWIAVSLILLLIAGVGAFFLAYSMIDVPDPNEDFTTETTEVYYSDGKHVIGTFAIQNRDVVELAAVPDHVQDAVISAEDRTFWENAGIDVKGIIRAAWSNARSESTQGASTITQQYVKVLYLTQERTWTRKLKEAILSLKVQRQLTKEEVLQGYLNTIYFGRGAYGIQAAAEAYFDKDVQNLSVAQGAVLASVLNSPSAYDPAAGKDAREALLARYQYVLDGMAEMGSIDPEQADKLGRELPKFPKPDERNSLGGQRGFLMDLVEQELLDSGKFTESDIYGGGLKVITTFDYRKQRAAQQVVKDEREKVKEAGGKKYKQLHIALSSVEPGTGAVKALYAGHNYLSQVKNAQFNWATHGVQPGSSFKPFAVAAALQADYTLDDVFDGRSPYYIEATGEDVENQGDSGGDSYGPITLLDATEHSVNTAFVDLTLQLGEDDIQDGANKILRAAEDAGIPKQVVDDIDPVAVTSLGYAPVPNIDMANAYATFAAEGEEADWFTVKKVTDASGGKTLYNHQVKTREAFPAKIANDVSFALQQVIDNPEGTGADAAFKCPAAGKTGTATAGIGENTHVSSSWFVGYTPNLSTAVTFARDDGDGQLDDWLDTFYGGDHPAETWRAYMRDVYEDQACVKFPKSEAEKELEAEPTETTPTETEESETEPSQTEPTETEKTKTHPTHPPHPNESTPTATTPSETTPTEPSPTETSPTCDGLFCDGGPGGGGPGGGQGGGQGAAPSQEP
jgi:membrane peptidoglycan carboxypeptidase